MKISIENFKFLSDEELSTLSFWELVIYMNQLNDVEKVYKTSLKGNSSNANTPTNNIDKDGGLGE